MKLLSIAVPSYNVEAYLERGLSSYADHRFDDTLEVIVVNDGSTDATEQIARRYAEAFPAIFTVITKENGGHGSAVNTALAHATGAYFRVIDGDDWVKTDNLAALLARLAHTETDAVVDEMTRVDMATMAESPCPFPDYITTNEPLRFSEACNIGDTESFIDIHTLSVRTKLLREHGIRISEGIFYVDYEFIVKAICYVGTVTFMPLDIYRYLVGNASQSMAAQNMVKRYTHHETVLKALLAFADTHQFEPEIERYLERKIQLLVHTHYNILLIFDDDRARGRERGRAFRAWLKREHPHLAASTKKRYLQALGLHYAGFDAAKLDRLMGRGEKEEARA